MKNKLATKKLEKRGIDIEKLSLDGSMNYILQIFKDKDELGNTYIEYDVYQPRKNHIHHAIEMVNESKLNEIHKQIIETIERLKIAQILFQDFLDGKRDDVYYWQADDEDKLRYLGILK